MTSAGHEISAAYQFRNCQATPYAIGWMTGAAADGSEMDFKVVVDEEKGGRVIPEIAEILIGYQENGQRSGGTYADYAKVFLDFLYIQFGLNDLTRVSMEHIWDFVRNLKYKEGKKAHTIRQYSFLLDKIFDTLCVRGRIPPDSSLMTLSRRHAAATPNKGFGKHYTFAGDIMRMAIHRMKGGEPMPMKSYEKTFSPEEIKIVLSSFVNLRDKCIFTVMCETGYRLDSALSISNNIELLSRCKVEETHSKTGQLHNAQISESTKQLIEKYIQNERTAAVRKAGYDCGKLFVALRGKTVGKPLAYHAFYQTIRRTETRIHEEYPDMADFRINTHGCRATFLNIIMDIAQSGKKGITDINIMGLMDWSSTQSLRNYRDMRRPASFDKSGLYKETFKRLETDNGIDTAFAEQLTQRSGTL